LASLGVGEQTAKHATVNVSINNSFNSYHTSAAGSPVHSQSPITTAKQLEEKLDTLLDQKKEQLTASDSNQLELSLHK
jgi:hypothetical protein